MAPGSGSRSGMSTVGGRYPDRLLVRDHARGRLAGHRLRRHEHWRVLVVEVLPAERNALRRRADDHGPGLVLVAAPILAVHLDQPLHRVVVVLERLVGTY